LSGWILPIIKRKTNLVLIINLPRPVLSILCNLCPFTLSQVSFPSPAVWICRSTSLCVSLLLGFKVSSTCSSIYSYSRTFFQVSRLGMIHAMASSRDSKTKMPITPMCTHHW
jgi:hypothetical protein